MMLSSPLVSVDWLHSNIAHANLIVLDASIAKPTTPKTKPQALACISNTVFFDLKHTFTNTNSRFPNTLPTPRQFETEARAIGINTDSVIVVYDDKGMYSSARVWWLFNVFGFKNVAVLDGGLPEWKKKGYSVSNSYRNAGKIGNFKADFNLHFVSYFEDIKKSFQNSDVLILDARSEARFNGRVSEPRKDLRSGNIPNSVNLPYTNLLNGNTLKTTKQLISIFNTFVSNHNQLIFSCGSGITACNLTLAAILAGLKHKCL